MGIVEDLTGYAPSLFTWTVWLLIPSLLFFAGNFLLFGMALGIGGIMNTAVLDLWITQTPLQPTLGPLARFGSAGITFGITLVTLLVHFLMSSGSAETAALAPLIADYAQQGCFNVTMATLAVSRAAMNVLIFPYQSVLLAALWERAT